MIETGPPKTGLALVLELKDEYCNYWDGGDANEVVAAAAYVVCIKRDSDGWLLAAENWQQIAHIERGCLLTDGTDVEYVDAVFEVASGKRLDLEYRTSTSVALRAPNGEVYYSFSPHDEPTWEIVTRDSDYGNDYETFPGMTPGVRTVEIDPGADFSNGRPSRYWCAERYFNLEDDTPTHVKRGVLNTLKVMCSGDDKRPRGEDPGTW